MSTSKKYEISVKKYSIAVYDINTNVDVDCRYCYKSASRRIIITGYRDEITWQETTDTCYDHRFTPMHGMVL